LTIRILRRARRGSSGAGLASAGNYAAGVEIRLTAAMIFSFSTFRAARISDLQFERAFDPARRIAATRARARHFQGNHRSLPERQAREAVDFLRKAGFAKSKPEGRNISLV